jgi:hypothetical protein
MARRAGMWVLGGATAAAGALIARPEAYRWLRRTTGFGTPSPTAATAPFTAASAVVDLEDETFDTREARLSLAARLHETGTELAPEPVASAIAAEPEATVEAEPEAEAKPEPKKPAKRVSTRPRPARATREQVEPLRRNVEEARTRMRQSARKAAQESSSSAA